MVDGHDINKQRGLSLVASRQCRSRDGLRPWPTAASASCST